MESYWKLSGPIECNRISNCRSCRRYIQKGSKVMVRDGRKLRLFYHLECFTGTADPRTQLGSSYEDPKYQDATVPNISGLEGRHAYCDLDGRPLGREIFKSQAPTIVGHGKWSVSERGYKPK